MKKRYCFLLFLLVHLSALAQVINFPDANFKAKLLTSSTSNNIAKNAAGNSIKIDANNNGQIEQSEALQVYKLFYVNPYNGAPPFRLSTQSVQASLITDLTGIAFFANLTYLNVSNHQDSSTYNFQLPSLNLSANIKLKELNCNGNSLTSATLNLTGLVQLESLDISYNNFTSCTLSGLTALKSLSADNNLMSALSISGSPNLETLNIAYNQFTGFSLVGYNALKYLYCRTNQITALNLNNSQVLEYLDCGQNQITTLNLSNMARLTTVSAYSNAITTLNLNGSTNLKKLVCSENQLTYLNVESTLLEYLNCSSNAINALNFNAPNTLNTFYCSGNAITFLDLSNYVALTYADCGYNPITSLLFSNNIKLKTLRCTSNKLMTLDLSSTKVERLYCSDNPNLSYINLKNNVISTLTFYEPPAPPFDAFSMTDLPSLTQVCCDTSEVQVLQSATDNQSDISIGDFCSTSSIVTLRMFLQGYYNTANHSMCSVRVNQGQTAKVSDVDTVTVELRQQNGHLVAVTSSLLKTSGMLSCAFNSAPSGSYYIVIKNRNCIETWSGTPQTVGSTPLVYDFTSSASKAFEGNMKQLEPGVFGFYSGDVNQDGFVEISDFAPLMNDSDRGLEGLQNTDLNGDGFVEIQDFPILFNNSNMGVEVRRP